MTNNQPDHLIKPAFEIGDWFESRNIKDWIVGPCASRQLVESLYKLIAGKDAEIERLSERRCEVCGYAEHHREHTGCLRVQLAASQAREAKLREAFSRFIDAHEECTDFDGFTSQIVSMDDYHEADEAISTPPDTAALEEYVMSRLEVVAFHHDDEGLSYENSFTGNVTLYRIKEKTEWKK